MYETDEGTGGFDAKMGSSGLTSLQRHRWSFFHEEKKKTIWDKKKPTEASRVMA